MEDKVFGTLSFNIGWTRKCNVVWWSKEITVDIRVSCYQTEVPNEKQQEAFEKFIASTEYLSEKMKDILYNYINKEYGYTPKSIWNFLKINEILFFQNGNYAVICSPLHMLEDDIIILISDTEIKIGGGFLIEFQS